MDTNMDQLNEIGSSSSASSSVLRPTSSPPPSLSPPPPPLPSSSPMIPLSPYLDTLSLLCIMLLLPDWVVSVILVTYIVLGSSRLILGRCLALLFGGLVTTNHPNNTTLNGLSSNHPPSQSLPPQEHVATALSSLAPKVLTSLLIDIVLLFNALLLQNQVINFIKIALYASIASSFATYKSKAKMNSFLAGSTVILLQILYSVLLNTFDLPTYAQSGLSQTSLTINHILYLRKSWRVTFKFITEFINVLLSIHICILSSSLSQVFPFTSYSLPLANIPNANNNVNTNSPTTNNVPAQVLTKDSNDILTISVPKKISESTCPSLFFSSQTDSSEVPASYPQEQLSNLQDISSSSTVVSQNFENYCTLASSNKRFLKRRLAFSQPMWSLLLAIKAMIVDPDTYSGEDKSTALVQFSKMPVEESKSVQCFVFLVSQTEIGLELIGCEPLTEVSVRINSVVWPRIDTVRFKESTLYVKISMLPPLAEYHVEVFNKSETGVDEEQYLVDVIVSTTSNIPNSQQPVRNPPLIILQQSLETTVEKTNREKQFLKKLKKDHQKKLTAYKNDIANRKKKLDNDKDERNHRKIMSLRATVSSFEQEYSKINDDIMECYTVEAEIHDRFIEKKREFDLRFRELDKVEKDYESEKKKKLLKIENLNNELTSLQNKNDRLNKKVSRISEELIKIQSELQSLFEKDIAKRQQLMVTLNQAREEYYNKLALENSKLTKTLEQLTATLNMLKKTGQFTELN